MDEEKLIIENERLAYYLLNKYYNIPSSEYEDVESVAKIGLIKAAKTFDESKKVKFSTYASRCILNEINMYFRKYNKQRNHVSYVSLDEIISTNQQGIEIMYRDIIPDEKSNYVKDIMMIEECMELITKSINLLETREKIILLYKLAGLTQREIGNILDISQTHVSRIQKAIQKKLKPYKDKYVKSKTISFEKVNDYYQITFTEKLEEIREVFSDIYINNTLQYGKIKIRENSVIITLNANNKAFKVVADILYKILLKNIFVK